MKWRQVKKRSKRLLTHDEWAERVLRELLEMRREVRVALAAQADQIVILQQQQTEMLEAINVLGGDVQQVQDAQAALVKQLQDLNSQIPQDLQPLIDGGNAVLTGLGGIRTRLESATTPAPTDTTSPSA